MHRRAWVLVAALAALWGASYLFIKVALDDLPPAWIVFVRTALGALVLLPVAIRRDALGPLRARWRHLVVLSVFQIVGPFVLITVGEQHIASSLAGILVSSAPIFTALLAVRFAPDERSHGWALGGVLIGIVGVGLLFGVDLGGSTSMLLGGAAILAASLGYAAGALYLRRTMVGVQPVAIAAGTMTLSALWTVPALPFAVPSSLGLDSAASITALGVGGTGLAFLIFYTLIADVGAARASIVAYVAPGFSIAYGAILLGESVSVATFAGLGLILGGSYLAAEGRLPWRPRAVAPAAPEPAEVPERRAA